MRVYVCVMVCVGVYMRVDVCEMVCVGVYMRGYVCVMVYRWAHVNKRMSTNACQQTHHGLHIRVYVFVHTRIGWHQQTHHGLQP